jgi:hypothetical protein
VSAGDYYAEKAEGEPVDGWVPEFPGQRPPFPPGNTLTETTTHGAYSPRKVDPLAKELVDLLLGDPSVPMHAKAAAYRLELWALARATAQTQLIEEWLADQSTEKHPIGDLGDERVRSAYLLLHRVETRAASSRSRLGLTPVAAARLGKNVAQAQVAQTDVALRMAQLRELEAQGWTPPPGWAGGADVAVTPVTPDPTDDWPYADLPTPTEFDPGTDEQREDQEGGADDDAD